MKKIKGLIRLLRFELPFSAGVCVVMGQLLALGKFTSLVVTVFGFASVFFISASILVLNDYFDIETDKVNAPHRPIPSGLVAPVDALMFSIILMFAGLFLSYMISIATLICSVVLIIIGFLYNRKLKKSGWPGNVMVSFSVGMTFIYGGISVGLPYNKEVIVFALIAALIDLGEEIAADAMDMDGDKLINSNSLAIKYGKQAALKTSSYIFILVILLTSVPFILNWFAAIYLVPILIMDTAIVYSLLKLLKSENDKGRKYIRWIYLGATFGIIVFVMIKFING
ncbi:MAG: prenyltransferase [Ignavibacteriales bacterium]|nr:MAG: prenyltransferase [Ignavibacteriales bacterium]